MGKGTGEGFSPAQYGAPKSKSLTSPREIVIDPNHFLVEVIGALPQISHPISRYARQSGSWKRVLEKR